MVREPFDVDDRHKGCSLICSPREDNTTRVIIDGRLSVLPCLRESKFPWITET